MRLIATFMILVLLGCSNNFTEIKNDSGRVIEKYQVNDKDQKHGLYNAFSDEGKMTESAQYNNGQLTGERKIYSSGGILEIIEIYENGQIVTPYKLFYPSGALKLEAEYKDGMMHGILKTYYEEGGVKEQVTMQNNNENGPFKEYHANGQLEWEGQYLNGDNEFGLLKNFDDSGELIKKMMCDSIGVCKTIWTKEKGDINPEN